ncbi:hypothetical protein KJ975_02370 [Myxococcota bacterium]|nr:hypothetical protein [Myxococcota bacterium]
MPFWRRPELSDIPEGQLSVPDDAGEPAREAIAAFNAGDFSRCRRILRELGGPDAAGADATVARELEQRLRMDPVLLGIAAVSLLLLVFLAIWAVTVSH